MNSAETERLAEVAAMRERMARPQQDLSAVCENCHLTLGEHKGSYCVTGPKHFRTIANTTYRGRHDMSTTDLRPFLSHPDAFVRSYADWALEFRGEGTRGLLPSEFAAARFEADMNNRLLALRRAGLDSSPAYTLP